MGALLGPSSGRRSGRRRRRGAMSEINVTPFVDVMLVLLIVFMVTAPLLTAGIEIDLPEARAEQMASEADPLTITIQADGAVFLQNTETTKEELLPTLTAIAEAAERHRCDVTVCGEMAGRPVEAMALIGLGYRRLSMSPASVGPVKAML